MPRKPRLPHPDLHIEGLSGVVPKVEVPMLKSDFDDTMFPMKPQAVHAKPQRIGPLKRKQHLMEQAAQRQALAQTPRAQAEAANEFIRKRMQPTLRSPAKPGEQAITLGPNLVIIIPSKPWRRL